MYPWNQNSYKYIHYIKGMQYSIVNKLFKLIDFGLHITIIPIFNFVKAWDYNNFQTNYTKTTPIRRSSAESLYMSNFKISVGSPNIIFRNVFAPIRDKCCDVSLSLFTSKYNFMLLKRVTDGSNEDSEYHRDTWPYNYSMMNVKQKRRMM